MRDGIYVYSADLWCESCGEAIVADLLAAGEIRPAYDDSDLWPVEALASECDYPAHCASGGECLEGIDLLAYGLPTIALAPVLIGAETQRVGAIVCDSLTSEGEAYTREMIQEDETTTPYQRALHRLWREVFELGDGDNEDGGIGLDK